MRDLSMSPNPHRPVSLRISLLDKIIFRRRSASVVCADTTTLLSSHPAASSHFPLSHSPSLPLVPRSNSGFSLTPSSSLIFPLSPLAQLKVEEWISKKTMKTWFYKIKIFFLIRSFLFIETFITKYGEFHKNHKNGNFTKRPNLHNNVFIFRKMCTICLTRPLPARRQPVAVWMRPPPRSPRSALAAPQADLSSRQEPLLLWLSICGMTPLIYRPFIIFEFCNDLSLERHPEANLP